MKISVLVEAGNVIQWGKNGGGDTPGGSGSVHGLFGRVGIDLSSICSDDRSSLWGADHNDLVVATAPDNGVKL